MKRGTMVSLDAVTFAIQEALDEVERQTGLDVESVRVSVGSAFATCDNHTEELPIKSNEVRATEIEKLSALVRAHKAPSGFDYIHNLHGHYMLDGKSGIQNPLGMWGDLLSAVYHRVLFPQSDLHNIIKACNQSGLRVQTVAMESLTSAESVLNADEKELGSVCINIGSTLTHVSIFANGAPIYCKDYPIGSNHITKDLSVGLRTTQSEAERIKREFGQAYYNPQSSSEVVEILTVDPKVSRTVTRGEILNIIDPRVKEIFQTVSADLRKHKLTCYLLKSVVLCGGGASLNGMCVVAEDHFNLYTRIGSPLMLSGLTEGLKNPLSVSAVGLLSPLFDHSHSSKVLLQKNKTSEQGPSLARTLWDKIRQPFG
jgi:cell division protein FtsA